MPAMIEETEQNKEKKTKRAVKRKGVDKWKKKKWFSIVAPDFFGQHALGETVAEEDNQVMGRSILSNAAEVTNQSKMRHVWLSFQVNRIQGQKATTHFVGHEIQDSYIRRLVRRKSSKIETIQDVQLKTGEKVHVKAVTITSKKASRAQETQIRKRMQAELTASAEKKALDQFMQEIIFGNVSSNIFKSVKKILPIKRVEITKSLVTLPKTA